MKWLFSILLVMSLVSLITPKGEAGDDKDRRRMEDLFIWKISEELDLSVDDERWLTTTLKSLGQEKMDLQRQLDGLAQSLKKQPEKLSSYKAIQKKLHTLQINELNQIEKKLGPQKAALYIYYRSELYKRVMQIIDSPEPKKLTKPLPPPKVIDEAAGPNK